MDTTPQTMDFLLESTKEWITVTYTVERSKNPQNGTTTLLKVLSSYEPGKKKFTESNWNSQTYEAKKEVFRRLSSLITNTLKASHGAS